MINATTSFEAIAIDKTEIPQDKLDIENKIRSNLFAWNGQFSPQFIETLLEYYASENEIVIDPFAGSGTTLCEAARKNLAAYGMELNASAYYMAKTYELANKSYDERIRLIETIDSIISTISGTDDILPVITDSIQRNGQSEVSNLLSTLVVLIDLFNNDLSMTLLQKKWDALKRIALEIPFSSEPINMNMGDARQLACEDSSASLLITSPPYINVFNYHQKYRRSVEALGYDVLATAKSEFGSNRKYRGNRLFTVVQYCIDMALSIKEAIRVCKEDSRMIYVVGRESKVLGYSFCNSQLIYEIATQIFHLPLLLRQERVFKNRFGMLIYEDILHFGNSKDEENLADEIIVSSARSIGVNILQQKAIEYPDASNVAFIYEAIEKASRINKSEV